MSIIVLHSLSNGGIMLKNIQKLADYAVKWFEDLRTGKETLGEAKL